MMKLRLVVDTENIYKISLQEIEFAELKEAILEQLPAAVKAQIPQQFSLQYLDKDFNEYVTSRSLDDLEYLITVKIVTCDEKNAVTGAENPQNTQKSTVTNPSSSGASEVAGPSGVSSVPLRTTQWSYPFQIPTFEFITEEFLRKANKQFQANGVRGS